MIMWSINRKAPKRVFCLKFYFVTTSVIYNKLATHNLILSNSPIQCKKGFKETKTQVID